jgi:hypothetical protein
MAMAKCLDEGNNSHDDEKQQPRCDPDGINPRMMMFIKSKRSEKQYPEHNARNPSPVPLWPPHACASPRFTAL